jgi:hypothetical protein
MIHDHDHGPGGCDTTGRHGMLLFGADPTYLSHLPMFDCPHNYQVHLAVRLDDAAAGVLAADRAQHGDTMHTFDPVEFPIDELDTRHGGPLRTAVEGVLVRGHFERGGTPIATGVTAHIQQVVYFDELDLDAKATDGRDMRYLCYGRAGRFYLAHQIGACPSFDQVLAVRLVPGTVTNMLGDSLPDDVATLRFDTAQPVRLGREDLAERRLSAGETVSGTFEGTSSIGGAHGFGLQLEVERELYLEVGELA